MEWFIENQLFILPCPCIRAGRNFQVTLLSLVIVDTKDEVPRIPLLDEEGVSNKFGRHIGHILCSKKGINPALQFIEVKRTITAVNANGPLFTLGNERHTPFNPDNHATNETKRQTN